MFKSIYDTTPGDKDSDGNTISGTKKANVETKAEEIMPWLTDEEMDYLKSNYWTS